MPRPDRRPADGSPGGTPIAEAAGGALAAGETLVARDGPHDAALPRLGQSGDDRERHGALVDHG